MTTPTIPPLPTPAQELTLCAWELWGAFGGMWDVCSRCIYREVEECPLEDWRACDFIQQGLLDAGEKNMIIPDEPTSPQPPNPAHEISICARDLWEAYGGQWPECIHCPNLELETCSLQDWHSCDLLQQALDDAGSGR